MWLVAGPSCCVWHLFAGFHGDSLVLDDTDWTGAWDGLKMGIEGVLVTSALKKCPGPAQEKAEPMGLELGFKVQAWPETSTGSQHSEGSRPGLRTPELALNPWLEGPVVQK